MATRFLLLLLFLLLSLLFFHLYSNDWDGPWKLPFRTLDILPLLPFSALRPILSSVYSAVDLLPTFVGTVSSPENSLQWKGACFYNNSAWMEFHNKSKSPYGGGTLHLKVSNAHSWTCLDLYAFATPFHLTWDYYFLSREHTIEFHEWEGEAEYEYVKHHGVSIFLMKSGMLGTLRALWDVFPLFTNTGWGENSNVNFLKKHMGAKFEERPEPWFSSINVDDIHSGDFLVLSKIRGRWGGFETLEKWVTGAYGGHSAVCLKDSEGKLWVAESGHANDKVASGMILWSKVMPDYAANLWNEALNKRLGTEDLDLPDIIVETEERGSSFAKLLAIPEQDDWIYSDGSSTSCVAFILQMYKHAGLFDPISRSIQVTEFTIKDAYTLNFFESNSSRLPEWCNKEDSVKLPFCQIKGKYRMELPDYNTIQPYPRMNEKCPSLPPNYDRPSYC
ncbi:uncharacterized protein LOC110093632 isoform X2 [Dendrobium catenatum]|uniref:uncharacterized protein LOC110093632 isoform X2 n=1 Tax=Dendrobium catenatum TaxID=906689 RepID=UPI00109F2EE7|nr:uncharacterized protein LOC110093632 isoform X2 [Dendrobium catenatum]